MKLISKLGIALLLLVSCDDSDNTYVKSVIYSEVNYSLSNFTILSLNSSGVQFGSDFDEQFVLGLDSNNFENIVKRMSSAKSVKLIGDSLLQYDREISNMGYLSIQLNRRQQTLTYTHWSD